MILDLTNLTVEHIKLLSKISVEIHDDFNKLTEDILNSTDKTIVDLVSNIVSRHPYQSPLFKICYTLVFISKVNNTEKIDSIITKDYDIYKVIKKLFPLIDIEFNGEKSIKQQLKIHLEPLIDLLYIFISIKRELLSKKSKMQKCVKHLKSIILIDTFFLQKTIVQKKYDPRYYTGILNYLDDKIKSRIFFIPQILSRYSRKDLNEIINNSEENILYKHDFLKVIDYLKILILLVKQRINKQNKFVFIGFDMTDIIIEQSCKTRFNSSSFSALKNYFFIKRLKIENVNLGLLIDWNENQPIDKGLIKGMHDFYPDVKTKGYRGFIISHDYNLYLSPTSFEVKNKVIPDEINIIGKGLVNETKRFYNKINVSLAPAFRFMDIHNPVKTEKEEKKILVALPIGLNDSIDILRMLSEANQHYLTGKYYYLIKPHPSYKIEKIQNMHGSVWLDNFESVDGALKESLIRTSLFISNTSSAILESLAYGIPGIIVAGTNTIVQNPIPKSVNKKIWKLVYTPEELAEAINFYMNASEKDKDDFRRIGVEVKDGYFMPVTKEKVNEFLELR